jgi:hypothetical protein
MKKTREGKLKSFLDSEMRKEPFLHETLNGFGEQISGENKDEHPDQGEKRHGGILDPKKGRVQNGIEIIDQVHGRLPPDFSTARAPCLRFSSPEAPLW